MMGFISVECGLECERKFFAILLLTFQVDHNIFIFEHFNVSLVIHWVRRFILERAVRPSYVIG